MLSIMAKMKDKEGLMQLIDQSLNKFADNYEAMPQTTRHAREINEISLSLEIGLKGLSLWPNDESLVILSETIWVWVNWKKHHVYQKRNSNQAKVMQS